MDDYSQPQAVLDAAAEGNLEAVLRKRYLERKQRQKIAALGVPQDVISEPARLALPAPKPKMPVELIESLSRPALPGMVFSPVQYLRFLLCFDAVLSAINLNQAGRRIILETALKYGFAVSAMKSRRRPVKLVQAKHEACWRIKRETSMTLPEIGKAMGGRDHTTILHSINRYDEMRAFAFGGPAPGPGTKWDMSKVILDEVCDG